MPCTYDCSRQPTQLEPYPDISGIGVVIGYVTTAGLAVIIITFYYLTGYRPEKDPFSSRAGQGHPQFRPNPIDKIFLSHIRDSVNSNKACDGKKQTLAAPVSRLERFYMNSVLRMSDIQMFTGISILISGYAQLRCGLSCYHWQLLVDLAWFSALTHLSCLTFLRHYLHHRPIERWLRLGAMFALLVMLLVAIIPTGNFQWFSGPTLIPTPSDFAICYFRKSKITDNQAFGTMILSAVLLGLGFALRVIKLHRSLSVGVIEGLRIFASVKMRFLLKKVYNMHCMQASSKGLKRTLLYRPILAMFLTARVLLDVWNSMLCEVWWLIASFTWGVVRLTMTRNLYNNLPQESDWTFGQIVAVVLVAAPILDLAKTLSDDDAPSEAPSHPSSLPTACLPAATPARNLSAPPGMAQSESFLTGDAVDNPNRDYYRNIPWVRRFTYFILCHIAFSTMQVIVGTTIDIVNPLLLFIPVRSWLVINWLPIHNTLMLTLFVLFSLLIEDLRMSPGSRLVVRKRNELAEALTHVNFAVFLFTSFSYWNLTLLEYGPEGVIVILGALVVIYVLCCLLVKVYC